MKRKKAVRNRKNYSRPNKILRAKKSPAIYRTGEELLIRKIAQKPLRPMPRRLQIQDLLYNTAQELQSLAFNAGFNLGIEAYANSEKNMSALEHILENAGLGRIIYYPFESKSVIASRTMKQEGMNLGSNLHVFESGVISGYLSAHTKKHITVREQTCVFNGAPVCEFIATPGGIESSGSMPIEFPKIVKALADAISRSEGNNGRKTYYVLALKPLLNEPLFSEISKFLYLAGKQLPRRIPNFDYAVIHAAQFLGIEKASVARDKKGGTTVNLIYDHDTSTEKFVYLTTALLSGIMKETYGRSIRIVRRVNSKGIYSVRMQVLTNPLRSKQV
ncbi:MAG: 4-vinyl reductase [Candidatus Micrarchaeales archaeon]|jgi:predicted hydrocarbon binding protein